ncbi:protein of unknown function [Microbulbifer donghaiensis]|uniref:DUF4124 domain-containing protein n=1 Tax=Microbulbifer donghaiensis TaxID=494016 RepID=A0A1M5HXZ1_9GAMM|nr:DUF4124 domain-containing protein [Microbulbifer donghaiensis]SHG20854.1 protein of unknown function [Microbulbifer donghaiensis]
MRIALAILISILAISAHADGIYKWVDENGVVHFGAQPPKKEGVEVVRKPKSERYKQWQAEQQAMKAETTEDAATSVERSVAAKPEPQQDPQQAEALTKAQQAVRAQRCRMAQTNLKELTTHSRVREIGQDGKMRVLPEEERQQRIADAQQTIQENC